jgi:hypothetical protein
MRGKASFAPVATVFVLAGCAAVGVKTPPVLPSIMVTPAPTAQLQLPTPTASPTPSNPPSSVTDAVAFANPEDGLGVGSICATSCTLEVAATETGGRTWNRSVVVATLPMTENGDPFVGAGVRFQGDDAWIFGPDAYESHDGGHTWRLTLGGPILALEPYEHEVWAVTGCATQDTIACLPRLMVSTIGSNQWSAVSPQPQFAHSLAAGAAPLVLMERAPGGVAFLAQNIVPGPEPASGGQAVSPQGDLLLTSRNLGRSWQTLPTPCAGIQNVRSVDGVHVWLLCSIPCCTGNWVKSLWTSANGGVTWTERSSTDPTERGSIPFYGSAEALTVTTDGVGLLGASGSGGIWRSADLGTVWNATFVDDCIMGGDAVTETWFATPLIGWALAGGSVDPQCPTFLHTSNGGSTWSSLPSPF